MKTITTIETELQIINWDQYFNALSRDRVYHLVQEYSVQTEYSPFKEDDGKPPGEKDATYYRDFQMVEEIVNPSKVLYTQFMDQLSKAKICCGELSDDFQESVELAAVDSVTRFVNTEKCAVVKLYKDETHQYFCLAPWTRDDLTIKLLSFAQAAIVIYRPQMFTLFKVKHEGCKVLE